MKRFSPATARRGDPNLEAGGEGGAAPHPPWYPGDAGGGAGALPEAGDAVPGQSWGRKRLRSAGGEEGPCRSGASPQGSSRSPGLKPAAESIAVQPDSSSRARSHRGQGGTLLPAHFNPPERGCADRTHLSGHPSTLPGGAPLPGEPHSRGAPAAAGDAQQHRAGGRRGSSYTTRKNSFQRP